ncbi:hypothetical protein [Fusibacter tunisiensis]|uniref:Na+/H+ antiporter NhaC n=1 Tax=Fusibacter tunisiensis TaxID=1008308 RepID=A0ABS2MP97_9FIRM|nr:hypothetical protein [Fusibacter tunisiensis]MBM7561214.1 Na+/H+ antiporter NhaC [Fusibacter tunisiensis]
MSIIEWVFVIMLAALMLGVIFYVTLDLFRDLKYYKMKQKNVTSIQSRSKRK